MAITIARIQLGACRAFVGVTAAATGTPPTYTTHTDGAPATGTDVGATESDTVFSYELQKQAQEAEQELAPIAVYTIGEGASIEAVLMEHVYTALQMAFDNVGKEDIAAGEAFWFGGGTGPLVPTTTCVMLTARQPQAPTKFVVVQLYKCWLSGGMKVPFAKKKGSFYSVKFNALADLTRNAGDRIGYYRYETTA